MGFWQLIENAFENVQWGVDADNYHPAGVNLISTTTVEIPYSYNAYRADCMKSHLKAVAGADTAMATIDFYDCHYIYE